MLKAALVLTSDELVELTGRRRSDAQARTLDHMGIPYSKRPNGSIAVLRVVAERALGGTMTATPREPQLQP
jgi:hypothetical protein